MKVDLRQQAADNLRFIREHMERAERISAVSGIGAMLMGALALAAMAYAAREPDLDARLLIWIGAALPAFAIGVVASWFKEGRSAPAGDARWRFLLCLLPVLLAGALLTALLWSRGVPEVIPVLWMLLYGCGLLAAGTYAVRPVVMTGLLFVVAGLLSAWLPPEWSNVMLGATFGGLHLFFGYTVYRDHGG